MTCKDCGEPACGNVASHRTGLVFQALNECWRRLDIQGRARGRCAIRLSHDAAEGMKTFLDITKIQGLALDDAPVHVDRTLPGLWVAVDSEHGSASVDAEAAEQRS